MSAKRNIDVDRISLIETRVSLATKGPWISFVEGRDHESGSSFIRTAGPDIELSGGTSFDQDFIANARQDIEYLISEVKRLEELIGK